MKINNRMSTTSFNGFVKNATWSRVKNYAKEIGKEDEIKAYETFCKKKNEIDFKITAKHVTHPKEGNRIIVKVKSNKDKQTKGYELFYLGKHNEIEAAYNLLKKIFDPSAELYYKTFR